MFFLMQTWAEQTKLKKTPAKYGAKLLNVFTRHLRECGATVAFSHFGFVKIWRCKTFLLLLRLRSSLLGISVTMEQGYWWDPKKQWLF